MLVLVLIEHYHYCEAVFRGIIFIVLHGNVFNDPDVISERSDRHAVAP
jgi:hypothetical protein